MTVPITRVERRPHRPLTLYLSSISDRARESISPRPTFKTRPGAARAPGRGLFLTFVIERIVIARWRGSEKLVPESWCVGGNLGTVHHVTVSPKRHWHHNLAGTNSGADIHEEKERQIWTSRTLESPIGSSAEGVAIPVGGSAEFAAIGKLSTCRTPVRITSHTAGA
jgi:hypothetical protein